MKTNPASQSIYPISVRAIFRSLFLVCGLSLGATHAIAQSYTGVFSQDDEQAAIVFNVAMAGNVTLQTWSFGGGINAAGDTIAAGGFAPVVSLFDAAEELIGIARTGVAGNPDPVTGFRWDVAWAGVLNAGNYRAVLTQDGNSPFGPFLSDGFQQDGQGNYTDPAILGAAGSFILVDGSQRTGHWALDVATPVPEPETWGMLLVGLGILGLAALRTPGRTQQKV